MQLGTLFVSANARNRPAKREQYPKMFATAVQAAVVIRRSRIVHQLASAASFHIPPISNSKQISVHVSLCDALVTKLILNVRDIESIL